MAMLVVLIWIWTWIDPIESKKGHIYAICLLPPLWRLHLQQNNIGQVLHALSIYQEKSSESPTVVHHEIDSWCCPNSIASLEIIFVSVAIFHKTVPIDLVYWNAQSIWCSEQHGILLSVQEYYYHDLVLQTSQSGRPLYHYHDPKVNPPILSP